MSGLFLNSNKKTVIINLKESNHESNGDKNSNLLPDEYLNKIKPYLRDIIIDLQSSDTWKIQLTIALNFVSSKDTEDKRVITKRVTI